MHVKLGHRPWRDVRAIAALGGAADIQPILISIITIIWPKRNPEAQGVCLQQSDESQMYDNGRTRGKVQTC